MPQDLSPDELVFKVICVWCGTTIRRNAFKDIEAMCADCCHEMLTRRFRDDEQINEMFFASKR